MREVGTCSTHGGCLGFCLGDNIVYASTTCMYVCSFSTTSLLNGGKSWLLHMYYVQRTDG